MAPRPAPTYKALYPDKQPQTCEGTHRSAIHNRLAENNAYLQDVSRWKSPAWFLPEGPAVVENELFGRDNWFPYWKDNHDACHNGVALFDMSFMSKLLVQGRDTGRILNRMSTADVDDKNRIITYTQWLNKSSGIEADLTVTKLDPLAYPVITTNIQHNQVVTKICRQISDKHDMSIPDVTGVYCQIKLQGPQSIELLQSITYFDLSGDTFPFQKVSVIDINYIWVLVARITYVGKVGYIFFVPAESEAHAYDLIAGADETYDAT